MFFILSKIVPIVLLPSNFLFIAGLLGLLLLTTRFRRAGSWLLIASFVLIVVIGLSPFGDLLIYTLEQRFPPWHAAGRTPDGIVVLGGAINPQLSRAYGSMQVNGSAERITVMPSMARAYPNARIVYSGGDASLLANEGREASVLPSFLESLGIPRDRVVLEDRARNTYENAVFTKQLVQPKPGERWLLVTSAAHMPRAIGCFRRVGFPVEAYPVDWAMAPPAPIWPSQSIVHGVRALDFAAHEWTGLLAYWLRGRTSEFFPSPAATR
jgi:uncharacterized SAM-binding protein YcdF (DUF218 family)